MYKTFLEVHKKEIQSILDAELRNSIRKTIVLQTILFSSAAGRVKNAPSKQCDSTATTFERHKQKWVQKAKKVLINVSIKPETFEDCYEKTLTFSKS